MKHIFPIFDYLRIHIVWKAWKDEKILDILPQFHIFLRRQKQLQKIISCREKYNKEQNKFCFKIDGFSKKKPIAIFVGFQQ